MKTILIAAISLDGKISTNANLDAHFSSKKDKAFFRKEAKKAGVSIVGSKTYKAAIKSKGLIQKVHHVVMTRTPEKYANKTSNKTSNKTEFTKASPKTILKNLEKQEFKTAVISGGSYVYTAFLRAKLVDEMYLTLTSNWFGKGIPLFQGGATINFKLYKVEKLGENEILLKYKKQ